MGPRVVHIIHNPKLFIASRALISRPRVIHIIHSHELFIASRAFSSQPKFIRIIHNPELFITSRGLSSRPRVVHIINNLKLFIKCRVVDPHPIHRLTRLVILKVKGKTGFRVLKYSSQRGTVLFGVATYFLFLFLNGENLSKNKNPNMTIVRKKRYAKTRFWVRGSGYLSGRYLMRGSTPLGP